jgi:hypothetical protein
MSHSEIPEGACCEICGLDEPLLLSSYLLGKGRERSVSILCQIHAAPLETGILGLGGEVHAPSRGELHAFWEERRPGVIWLSPERRILRDRREHARFSHRERRRTVR